jgi:hypothetical protein
MKNCKIVLLLIALSSCLRENLITDIELPNYSPLPVVFGLFTPSSDSLLINLRWSVSINSQELLTKDAITNAQIWLSVDNEQDSILLPHLRLGVYGLLQKRYPLKEGDSYKIRVSIPQQKPLFATFKIPDLKARYSKIEYGKAKIRESGYWQRDVVKYWKSVSAPVKNYFYYTAEKEKRQGNISITFNESEVIQQNNDLLFAYNNFSSIDKNPTMIFYLITCEKVVYDFLKSATILSDLISAKNVDLLTSFKGVLPEHGNVQNGLGFVGGYVISDTTIYVQD